jgi:repressor LexA
MLELYKNIRKYRKQMGLTQEELAKRIGYTDRSSIAKIENGSVDLPQSKITQIAKVFGISSKDLMGNDGIDVDPFSFSEITSISKQTFPLYDGIAAGQPRLMPDGIETYVESTTDIKADFVLRVHGDSMIGARIYDGDLVFIREQPDVENGEIAAVAIGDEATLKRIYRYGDTLSLRAENPAYKEMVFTGEELNNIRILGKAIAFQSDIL